MPMTVVFWVLTSLQLELHLVDSG